MNTFQKTAITTVIATLFLILVGGLVRAVGAGLGCPDWPTCFGMWIPPLHAEALPPGYDASRFNVFHTWLEYVNRLTGVVIGLLIAATFWLSLRYRKTDPAVVAASAAAFILVLVQGWLGGQVVRSGLEAGMITIHMLLAMFIVNILLFAAFRSASGRLKLTLSRQAGKKLMWIGSVLLALTLIQMVLGTQVREAIDVVKNAPEPLPREAWLDTLDGWMYALHRSFSWLVVLAAGWLWVANRKTGIPLALKKTGAIILKLVLLQIILGAGMEWLGMPGALQWLHLVSAALLICAEFLFLLMTGFAKTPGGSVS
ncbi:MAG: COX15/CtaA family protein [Balneolaceae bacterium]